MREYEYTVYIQLKAKYNNDFFIHATNVSYFNFKSGDEFRGKFVMVSVKCKPTEQKIEIITKMSNIFRKLTKLSS